MRSLLKMHTIKYNIIIVVYEPSDDVWRSAHVYQPVKGPCPKHNTTKEQGGPQPQKQIDEIHIENGKAERNAR